MCAKDHDPAAADLSSMPSAAVSVVGNAGIADAQSEPGLVVGFPELVIRTLN